MNRIRRRGRTSCEAVHSQKRVVKMVDQEIVCVGIDSFWNASEADHHRLPEFSSLAGDGGLVADYGMIDSLVKFYYLLWPRGKYTFSLGYMTCFAIETLALDSSLALYYRQSKTRHQP